MRLSAVIAAGSLLAASCFAAETPFGIKPGLWETKTTNDISGPPPIPPEALARMTPEQRERVEAGMKQYAGQNHATTTKACITEEQLSKPITAFGRQDASCKYDMVRSSSSVQELKFTCGDIGRGAGKMDGTMHFEAVNAETMKGNATIVMTPAKGNPTTMRMTMSGRRLSSDCGDVKPTGRR
jgi:hypothetical protein